MKVGIKLQSVSDIITNSSSETFQIQTEHNVEFIKDYIKKIHKSFNEQCSGMGGIIEVRSWKDIYEYDKQYYFYKCKREFVTPEIWSLLYKQSLDELKQMIWLEIDNGFQDTINHIIDNFNVVESDRYYEYYQIDAITKDSIRVVTEETWSKLPKNERFPNEKF